MSFFNRMSGKLWAAMMMLLGTTILLTWLIQMVHFPNLHADQRAAESLRAAKTVLGAGNAPQEALLRYEDTYNVKYVLFDAQGGLCYTSVGLSPREFVVERAAALLEEVVQGQELDQELTHPDTGNRHRLIGESLKEEGGALFVWMPVSDKGFLAATAQRSLLVISIPLIVLGAVISLLMARSFTRPILQVNEAAARMSEGELHVELDQSATQELADLIGTMNRLGISLRQSEQLKRELIANISHELRTPLSLIRGYAETVRDLPDADEGRKREQLDVIIDESDRLRTMVDTILDYSRLQSGFSPVYRSVQVFELLQEICDRYRPELDREGITLATHIQGTLQKEVDAELLTQAMYNLLNNALNHTPAGGRIDVVAYSLEDRVHVDIMDTGMGIPQAELSYVWDRFYKAQQTGRRKRGSGLGLSLVRSVVEAHQGEYGAENRLTGGAHFWFEI